VPRAMPGRVSSALGRAASLASARRACHRALIRGMIQKQSGGYHLLPVGTIRPVAMEKAGAILVLLIASLGGAEAAGLQVLVAHDAGSLEAPTEQQAVSSLRDMLGHFGCRVDVVGVEAYRAGTMEAYDATVYIGLRAGAKLPERFLADCYDSEMPICWLGSNLEQLAARFSLGRYGFRLDVERPAARSRRVTYRGLSYWRSPSPLTPVAVTRPDVCETLAVAEGEEWGYPYAIRSGRFWYFPEAPVPAEPETTTYLILADQLGEVLQARRAPRRTALLVIDHVGPDCDPRLLAGMVHQLEAEGVAFAVCVRPLVGASGSGREVRLSERRSVVSVLRGAQRAGGSIIADAFSEAAVQAAGSEEPGARTRRTMERALDELVRCGLYPLGWAAPRELGEGLEGREISLLCSTLWRLSGRGAHGATAQEPPFLVARSEYGQVVIPDNLMELREGRGEVEAIVEQARRQVVVAEPWATAVIAPEAPLHSAALLINGLRGMDYHFADLSSMSNWTRGKAVHIYSVGSATAAGEMIPRGWDGTLLGPGAGARRRFEGAGRDGREGASVEPGAVLVAYPRGERPRTIFALDSDPEELTSKLVYGIARVLVAFAAAAGIVLLSVYLLQVALARRG